MKSIHGIIIALLLTLSLKAAPEFVPGRTGQALRGRCSFPAVNLDSRQGSIQCWFKLDMQPAEMQNHFLLGIGTNRDGWFYIMFNAGKLTAASKSAVGITEATFEINALEPARWYNLTLTWGQNYGQGKLKVYLDGMLKAQNHGQLPETFSPGKLGLGYNTAHYASPDFPGLIDEFAFYAYPLPENEINDLMQRGAILPGESRPRPGCLIYAAFDGDPSNLRGPEITSEQLQRYLQIHQQKSKIRHYSDEIDFQYYFDVPMPEEKTAGILNDGNDHNSVNWHNRKIAVICEFDRTYDLAGLEIIVKKQTKWYILKELHISLDDGSGAFKAPFIVKTYGVVPKKGAALIDESCRSYCYRPEIRGYASRIKIAFVGDAAISVSEIRIRGRAAAPPPDGSMYFWSTSE